MAQPGSAIGNKPNGSDGSQWLTVFGSLGWPETMQDAQLCKSPRIGRHAGLGRKDDGREGDVEGVSLSLVFVPESFSIMNKITFFYHKAIFLQRKKLS